MTYRGWGGGCPGLLYPDDFSYKQQELLKTCLYNEKFMVVYIWNKNVFRLRNPARAARDLFCDAELTSKALTGIVSKVSGERLKTWNSSRNNVVLDKL